MSREHILIREVVARVPEDRPVRDTIGTFWFIGRHRAAAPLERRDEAKIAKQRTIKKLLQHG
jgi:hypothetical protein